MVKVCYGGRICILKDRRFQVVLAEVLSLPSGFRTERFSYWDGGIKYRAGENS